MGRLPNPGYPAALRTTATDVWASQAQLTLSYADHNHAPYGRFAQCTGLIAVAGSQFAHAVLATRGERVTNEKALLDRAGLRHVDDKVATMTTEPSTLEAAVAAILKLGHG